MSSSLESLHAECEANLRAGRPQVVARRLAGLTLARIPREWVLRLANVCRRAGLFTPGMKILAKVVHPENPRSAIQATSEELAEYAVLLQRSGAVKEAVHTLSKVDPMKVPEANLYRAFCHFGTWDAANAISCLEDYTRSPISAYSLLVGQVNLAAAYIMGEQIAEAMELIEKNIEAAGANNYTRLLGNSLELRAQAHLRRGNISEAKASLEQASQVFAGAQTLDELFVLKWQAIISGMESGDPSAILEFRELAAKRKAWEAVREADLFAIGVRFDERRFDHLMFGTPFAAYRSRITRETTRTPSRDEYLLGPEGSRCFDLLTGHMEGRELFPEGRKCHQLVEILLRDFYVPQRIGGLFAELFPNEYFDIFSSPSRVHQIIRRTRRVLESEGVPVEILVEGGQFQLKTEGEFSFKVPLERHSVDGHSKNFEALRLCFSSDSTFTAREARESLGLPRTSFQRFVNWALENGRVEKVSAHNATRYRLKHAA